MQFVEPVAWLLMVPSPRASPCTPDSCPCNTSDSAQSSLRCSPPRELLFSEKVMEDHRAQGQNQGQWAKALQGGLSMTGRASYCRNSGRDILGGWACSRRGWKTTRQIQQGVHLYGTRDRLDEHYASSFNSENI